MSIKFKSYAMSLLFLGITTSLMGCELVEETHSKSYEYFDTNCSTGSQKYTNNTEYCEALVDDRRNNFCAGEARYQEFLDSCPDMAPPMELDIGYGEWRAVSYDGTRYFGLSRDFRVNFGITKSVNLVDLTSAKSVEIPGLENYACAIHILKVDNLVTDQLLSMQLTLKDLPNSNLPSCEAFFADRDQMEIIYRQTNYRKYNGEVRRRDMKITMTSPRRFK